MPVGALREPPASLWRALAKIGPGIILAGSIIGTGELLLTTGLGAEHGFRFLWVILFSCVIKVFVQVELGRYTISSGLPTLTALDRMPGFRLGANWLVWWWFGMLLCTVSQLGAMVGGVGQALHLALPGVSPWLADLLGNGAAADFVRSHVEHPWAVLTALAATALLLSGGYRNIERVTTFLVVAVTLITVTCAALVPAHGYPITLGDIKTGFSLNLPIEGLVLALAMFGITGVGASELYSYPYWCLEKGYARWAGPCTPDEDWARRARGWMRVLYLDAWVSMIVFTVATVAFYVMGATVLHRNGLHPSKDKMIETLSRMYTSAFGEWTKILFLVGACAVLFKTLYVASAGHSRLTTDFLGLIGVVKLADGAHRQRWIRRFCVFYPLLALGLYLCFREPAAMTRFGGVMQAVTLPVISGAAVYLRFRKTDKRLAPSRWLDACFVFAFVSITLAVCGKWIYEWLSLAAATAGK